MKINYLNLFFALLMITTSCSAQTTRPTVVDTPNSAPTEVIKPAPEKKKEAIARTYLKWDEDSIDYGKVKKGEKRKHTYKFQNISKEDIDIMICTACDCTSLDWTTKTIKPGEFGEVETIFNSSEKDADETINITIILKNTDPVLHYPIVDEVKFHFNLEK